jgi:hypothetical protein
MRPMAAIDEGAEPQVLTPGTTTLLEEATVVEPTQDGDHERFSHIVWEGSELEDGTYVKVGPTVVESMVTGTPVRALCGKVWVPSRDPKKYPICPTCKEIAQQMNWKGPSF